MKVCVIRLSSSQIDWKRIVAASLALFALNTYLQVKCKALSRTEDASSQHYLPPKAAAYQAIRNVVISNIEEVGPITSLQLQQGEMLIIGNSSALLGRQACSHVEPQEFCAPALWLLHKGLVHGVPAALQDGEITASQDL